jgi:hypothetical protein
MTQFVIGVAALNHDSQFAARYKSGMKKAEYWEPALEDSLDCVAKSFTIAARIYLHSYKGGAKGMAPVDKTKDLSHNFATQIGFGDSEGFIELIRLYNSLHTDHEGGNVSAHTTHLVGSALSDPFLSYSAALVGLAGPLHGLANQEVLRFILGMQKELGDSPSDDQIVQYIWKTLNSGQVIPVRSAARLSLFCAIAADDDVCAQGYGHAVLRKPECVPFSLTSSRARLTLFLNPALASPRCASSATSTRRRPTTPSSASSTRSSRSRRASSPSTARPRTRSRTSTPRRARSCTTTGSRSLPTTQASFRTSRERGPS